MHFVDEIHLVAATGRRVLHIVEQLARVIDLGARRGVDLDQIDTAPGLNFTAAATLQAGLSADAALAVQTLRQNARHRSLADATSTGK